MQNDLQSIIERSNSRETVMLNFDTRTVPLNQQHDYWQEAISQVFVPLNCNLPTENPFLGVLETKQWTNLRLVAVKGQTQHVERNWHKIRKDTHDQILMSILLSGNMGINQNGRETMIQQGQFSFYDAYQPYDLHLNGSFDQLVLMIPRSIFQDRFGRIEILSARSFGKDHPLQRLVLNFSESLLSLPHELSLGLQDTLLDQYLDLLGCIVADTGQNQIEKPSKSTTLLQIKNLILQQISNSDLSIHDVAYHLQISTRYVSKLFQQEHTTFGRYLLENRLKQCKKLLCHPSFYPRSISELAFQVGFNDMSYFSREFKKYFGMSPKEMKKEHNLSKF